MAAPKNPSGGPQQAQALVDTVHESFAHAIACTSLIGGIIMAAGAAIVLLLLPGWKAAGKAPQRDDGRSRAGAHGGRVTPQTGRA